MTQNINWPSIYRGVSPVQLSVVIPGSKSVTNRALILAAQAKSPSLLRRPLVSRDSQLMVAGIKSLGIGIKEIDFEINGVQELHWKVTPAPLIGGVKIDVGNAGTVMRFLPPLAALAQVDDAFDGDQRRIHVEGHEAKCRQRRQRRAAQHQARRDFLCGRWGGRGSELGSHQPMMPSSLLRTGMLRPPPAAAPGGAAGRAGRARGRRAG